MGKLNKVISLVTEFIKKQLNIGITDNSSRVEVKYIQKTNFYSYMVFLFFLFIMTRNFIENDTRLALTALVDLMIILSNYVIFRIFKKVKLYTFLFSLFISIQVVAVLIDGGYNGSGLIAVGIYILTFMNLLGLKWGTIFTSIVFLAELLIIKYCDRVTWIYNYKAEFGLLTIRHIASQMGVYIFSFYNLKSQRELYKELHEEKETRKQLFLNIVHDLKTPLTIIHNNVNRCEKEHKNSDSIGVLKSNIIKMEKNILNILNLEKLERGYPVALTESVSNLSRITEEACELYKSYVASGKIRILSKIDKDIYGSIDEISFIQILNNLVENAIKYSKDEGLVYISLFMLMDKACLTVKDTGIGISSQEQKKIFNSYYQSHKGYSSYYGLGIGLALTKEICEAYNGEISVESKLGEGSRFTVFLPEAQRSAESDRKEVLRNCYIPSINKNIPETTYDPELETIMIVEDDPAIHELLINGFKKSYNVISASNGVEGLKKLQGDVQVDLIITDIMMPEMDGRDFLLNLRSDESNKKIPVIFLTARAGKEDVVEFLSLGAIDYICKPFDFHELSTKVDSILSVCSHMHYSLVNSMNSRISQFFSDNKGSADTRGNNKSDFADYGISPKEGQIITELSKGLSHKEIAYNQGISVNTVKSHIQRIYKKCKVQNSTSLLKIFYY